MAFAYPGIMASTQSESAASVPSKPPEPQSLFFSQRSRRQLGLFFAGAGFFAISSLITRRSIVRRYKATVPKFYQPNNRPNFEVNGAMEAFDALNIATINVFSLGMMFSGGLLYAFDIASVDDIRRNVRKNLGVDGVRTDQDVEEEIEEWFATVLDRKDLKEKLREDRAKGVRNKGENRGGDDKNKVEKS